MCRDLETNTRKIKPNIFKYAREQQPMSIINKTIRDKYLISNSRYHNIAFFNGRLISSSKSVPRNSL